MHRGEGRAIEPNGGHPVKAPGADKRHGLPQRRCHQRVHIGAIPVIEADHIRFFIHRQPIDANRRTALKVGFTLPGIDNAILVQHLLEQAIRAEHQHMPRIDKRRHQ